MMNRKQRRAYNAPMGENHRVIVALINDQVKLTLIGTTSNVENHIMLDSDKTWLLGIALLKSWWKVKKFWWRKS